jgi:hypothetical protein
MSKTERQQISDAKKKACAWFRKESLVTEPEQLNRDLPSAFVEVGTILAIEYASDKFDGKTRAYRHDATQARRLCISADGSTILIDPPFKITTRGIEG